MRTYKAIVERDPSGKYTLTIPALPGYVACGDSESEVIQLALEGVPFHLACLAEEGSEPPPAESAAAKVMDLQIAA